MATTSKTREIIDDFANEIRKKKTSGEKPGKKYIKFRNESINKKERDIAEVPLGLLRFRKENGRIAIEVNSWEKKHGKLDEADDATQERLMEWLLANDKSKTEKLQNLIGKDGQMEPAVATCDGFLIDGNRRLAVLKKLQLEGNANAITRMRVILLPDKNDEGGPPTIEEIERLENTYQLQDDGKSEYTQFAKALSFHRKDRNGFTIAEQITDDSRFHNKPSEVKNEEKNIREKYLNPLEIINRYLYYFGLEGQYECAANKWDCFVEYSKFFHGHLKNDLKRNQLTGLKGVENEVFEQAIFIVIRSWGQIQKGKSALYMRKLKKNCKSREYVKEICKLVNACQPTETEPPDDAEKWLSTITIAKKSRATIIERRLTKANGHAEDKLKNESPLELMEQANKKLMHKNMKIENLLAKDQQAALKSLKGIRRLVDGLESEIRKHMP